MKRIRSLPRAGILLLFCTIFLTSLNAQSQVPTRGLLREVWEGITSVAVADLTGSPDFPDHPTSTNYVTDLFESPTDVLDNYGQRMRGYLVPPITGDYIFWLASDDGGELFLSMDES